MKFIYKICSLITFINGVGHLLLVTFYERQSSFWLMLLFGCLYVVLGIIVWFKGKKPLLVTAGIMILVGMTALISIKSLGYPVKLLGLLIGMDFLVIFLSFIILFRKKVVPK